MSKNVAVILAGGVGKRLGADIPKQYIEVRGKPIIVYTLEKFEDSEDISAIEVVCSAEWKNYVLVLGEKYGISKLKWIAEGGASCQDSIRNGIFALRKELSDEDIVLLHMSVSPMISASNIAEGIRTCQANGNAFAVQPCLFCMCRKVNETWSDQNAYKEDFLQLNMPWIMKYGIIYKLYSDALASRTGTDIKDYLPSLMYTYGMKTYFYPDNEENRLKITTRADLDFFRAYLHMNELKAKELI